MIDPVELRARIESAMHARYGDRKFDSPGLYEEINRDLQLLADIFPELDITAIVFDDPPPTPRRKGLGAWVSRLLDTP